MKKHTTLLLIMAFASVITIGHAQAPYKHAVGVTAGGNFAGLAHKTFVKEHFAIQTNLGIKYMPFLNRRWAHLWALEGHVDLLYQQPFARNSNWSWFAGGGVDLGYGFNLSYNIENFCQPPGSAVRYIRGAVNRTVLNFNNVFGFEYCFSSVPLTLQFDLQVGLGLLIHKLLKETVNINDYLNLEGEYLSAEEYAQIIRTSSCVLPTFRDIYRMDGRKSYSYPNWMTGITLKYRVK
ncbi:MAG: hypothetical protein LBL18_04155 [Bacteroidales bacterium]|jgi:hypothetical protein|nr:hypothetical protein [Bacteroidales bacterium]